MRTVSQAAVLLVTAIITVLTNAGFLVVLNTAYYRELDTNPYLYILTHPGSHKSTLLACMLWEQLFDQLDQQISRRGLRDTLHVLCGVGQRPLHGRPRPRLRSLPEPLPLLAARRALLPDASKECSAKHDTLQPTT